jgi:hypothetical protein
LLLALILGLTLGGKKDSGGNNPPPAPPGPEPIDSGYNPYYLDDSSTIIKKKN